MEIYYSLIARADTVLCYCKSESGYKYEDLIMNILPNIPIDIDGKKSYNSTNGPSINVLIDNRITYICVCDDVGKTRPYEFLKEVRNRFSSSQLMFRSRTATVMELNPDFQPMLQSMMEEYGRRGNEKLSVLQAQVNEVKDVMTSNVEAVLARGERLEDLLNKTNELESSASTFHRTTRKVQRRMCWRNYKMTFILICVAIIIITILTLVILFSVGVLPPPPAPTQTPSPHSTLPKFNATTTHKP